MSLKLKKDPRQSITDVISQELGYEMWVCDRIPNVGVKVIFRSLLTFSRYVFFFITTYFLFTNQFNNLIIAEVWKSQEHTIALAASAISLLLTHIFNVVVNKDLDAVSKDGKNIPAVKKERTFHFVGDLFRVGSYGFFAFYMARLLLKDPNEVAQATFLLALQTLYVAMVVRQTFFWIYFGLLARDKLQPWEGSNPDSSKEDLLLEDE